MSDQLSSIFGSPVWDPTENEKALQQQKLVNQLLNSNTSNSEHDKEQGESQKSSPEKESCSLLENDSTQESTSTPEKDPEELPPATKPAAPHA